MQGNIAIGLAGCALTGGLAALACSSDSHRGVAGSGSHADAAGPSTVDAGDTTRLAIAHAPGGPPLSPQPAGAPHTHYYPAGAGVMDPMIISGPAVKEESKALLKKNDYGSVLYYCAEGPTPVAGPDRYCYRSFDGGKTFTRTPSDAFDKSRDDTNGFPLAGSVASDGTIYTCMTSTKGLAVSVSRDEGDTWNVVRVPGSAAGQTPEVLNDVFLSNNVTTVTTTGGEGTGYLSTRNHSSMFSG